MVNDKLIYDVDLARDVKLLASMNPDVKFVDDNLKKRLFNDINSDSLIRVGKVIGSLKIVSIDVIDKAFLGKVFEGL